MNKYHTRSHMTSMYALTQQYAYHSFPAFDIASRCFILTVTFFFPACTKNTPLCVSATTP